MDGIVTLIAQFDVEEFQPNYLMGLIAVPVILSLGLFFFLMLNELKGWSKLLKWSAMLPLLIGAFSGLRPAQSMIDPLYRDQYGAGFRSQLLHYGAVGIPMLVAAGLVTWGLIHDRQKLEDF